MHRPALTLLLIAALVPTGGCGRRDVEVGHREDGSPGGDGEPGFDAGRHDPFDPAAACGRSIIETERVPGNVLLAFDRSSSMASSPNNSEGEPTKWELATRAIESVLGSVSDELGAGLLLFPSGAAECEVMADPQVPIAPLSSSREHISAALAAARPNGAGTPIVEATRTAWAHLDTLTVPGPRGIVLVTDGAESCDGDAQDALLAEAADRLGRGHLTFVVGLTTANNFLSTLALRGGTPRSDGCKAECASRQCSSDAECPGSASCFQPIAFEPGLCGCETDVDCVSPQTCQELPFFGRQCLGPTDCCHHNATASSFEADFETALSEIARRFIESCVFEVPKDDPASFDPDLVNVGVTFAGEERTVVPRGSDPSVSSWSYADPASDTLVIHGALCERLRTAAATVEIVVGCPTLLI